jgi:hypothetical protein
MHSNDERLRQAYGAVLEGRAHSTDLSHPEPEALLAVAERSGSEAVRLEVLDHVMGCAACQRDLNLFRATIAAAGTPRSRTWFRSPSVGLMALAASLVLVAGVRLYMTSGVGVESGGPRFRGSSAVSTYPVRWLSSGDAGVAWRPANDAASYRVEVVDEAGTAVVDSTVRDTSLVIADALLRGRRGLSWSVTAALGDGSTIASLPVRLVPPAR